MSHVSMIGVRALTAGVESAGGDRNAFLMRAGLTPERLREDTHVSLEQYRRIASAALSTTGDPALGLHMGEVMVTSRFDAIGHLAEHSANLREALGVGIKYGRIIAESPRLELTEENAVASLRIEALSGDSASVRMTAEFTLVSLQHLVRRFAGRSAQPRAVYFAYEAPAHRAEYARLFGGRERFGHAFTGMELERAWLDRAQPCASSPELATVLKARADLLLTKLERDAPIVERVTRWLEAQSLQSRPRMDQTAQELGMSARSLRRRLFEERATFADLLAAAAAKRAKRLLTDERHSVQETAYAMGFNSPAAFSRAFKRWTGEAPVAFRHSR